MANRNLFNVPTLSATWDARQAAELRGALLNIRDNFAGGITEAVNTNSRYIEAVITSPTSASPRIATGLDDKPASVEVVEFYRRDPSYLSASIAGTLQWEWSDGEIVLPQLSGLTGNGAYVIKLLVKVG